MNFNNNSQEMPIIVRGAHFTIDRKSLLVPYLLVVLCWLDQEDFLNTTQRDLQYLQSKKYIYRCIATFTAAKLWYISILTRWVRYGSDHQLLIASTNTVLTLITTLYYNYFHILIIKPSISVNHQSNINMFKMYIAVPRLL